MLETMKKSRRSSTDAAQVAENDSRNIICRGAISMKCADRAWVPQISD